jgi:hypothetical protein
MTGSYDWKAEVVWPAEGYIDPRTGERHPWDEQVPLDEFFYNDGMTTSFTWKDAVGEQAEAAHMDVQEYLESMLYDRSGGDVFDEDDDEEQPW